MPLVVNAILVFTSYAVVDLGVQFTFTCPDPGAGEQSEYLVYLTDAELAGVANQAQLRTLLTTKLQRRHRATGVASKLDQFIGQSITI